MTSQTEQAYQTAFRLFSEFGFSVFPLADKAKKPRFSWSQYQTARASEDDLERWHERWPGCNWAIVTGKLSGCVVVDCDDESAVSWCRENLPATPFYVTTGRGCHLYYRYPQGDASWIKNIRPRAEKVGIDIRSDGGYVVAPDSIHPSGAVYTLTIAPWDAVPEFSLLSKETVIDVDLMTYEGNRNNTIAQLAGKLISEGKPAPEVLALCRQYNRDSVFPPLDDTEVCRTVNSILKTDTRNHPETMQLASLATSFDDVEPARDIEAEKPVPDAILHPGGIAERVMCYIMDSAVITHPVFAFAGAVSLLNVLMGSKIQSSTGLVTNSYVICVGPSSSGKDAPKKAILRLLKLVAPGLYAGSDVASDAAIVSHLAEIPSDDGNSSSSFGRGRALFVFDEIGMLLKGAQNPNSAKAGLVKTLTDLHSATKGPYSKTYANKEDNRTIESHCMCIHAMSVPGELYGALQRGETTNGFLARLLLFEVEKNPAKLNLDIVLDTPADLVADLKAMAVLVPHEDAPRVNQAGSTELLPPPEPRVISMTPEARKLHIRKMSCWKDRQNAYEDSGDDGLATVAGRAHEHAMRMMLFFAASRLGPGIFDSPTITVEDARKAWDVVSWVVDRTIRKVSLSVAVNEFDALTKLIKKAIIKYRRRELSKGGNSAKPGAPLDFILRSAPGYTNKTVQDAIDRLILANELRVEKNWKSSPASKRAMDLYILVTPKENAND